MGFLVALPGFEPGRPYRRAILSRVRLPIPTEGRATQIASPRRPCQLSRPGRVVAAARPRYIIRAWRSRISQLVEQAAVNRWVVGLSPSPGANPPFQLGSVRRRVI